MPNTRRSNIRRTKRRNTRRSNNRRVRRNTRRRNTRRRNTRRRNKRGKSNPQDMKLDVELDMDMLVEELGGFDTDDMLDQWRVLEAKKKLAWMKITREVMKTAGSEQQKLIDDIAEMVAERIS